MICRFFLQFLSLRINFLYRTGSCQTPKPTAISFLVDVVVLVLVEAKSAPRQCQPLLGPVPLMPALTVVLVFIPFSFLSVY